MKKTLLYTLASIGLLATSCQEKNEIEYTNLGSEFFISDSGLTSLDAKTTISIANDQKNLSTVELFSTDLSLGEVMLADGAGSMDLTLAQLGVADIEDEVILTGKAVIDGAPFERMHTVVVGDATSFETSGDLYEFQSVEDTLFISVSTSVTDITSVVIEGAHNEGPFEALTLIDVEHDGTSFTGKLVLPKDLVYEDSLLGKITATSSVRSELSEFTLYVNGKSFDYSGAGTVSSEAGKGDSYLYVFQPLDDDGEPDGAEIMEGMISYDNTSGDFAGITSTAVTFKKVGEDDDVANLSELVEFMTGATDKTVARVALGEKYAYTFVDAETVSHFGVMTITEALTVAVGDPLYGFSFSNSSTTKE